MGLSCSSAACTARWRMRRGWAQSSAAACALTVRATFLPDPVPPVPNPILPRGVLITRPEPGATETARRVAALDLVPVVASVTVVRNVPAELPDPEQLQAVLVASGNAIDALPQSH